MEGGIEFFEDEWGHTGSGGEEYGHRADVVNVAGPPSDQIVGLGVVVEELGWCVGRVTLVAGTCEKRACLTVGGSTEIADLRHVAEGHDV